MMKRPPRQSGTPDQDALARMRAAHPAGAALLDQHQANANLALALRTLRKSKGMTAADVRRASADLGRPLTPAMVSRLESPIAELPELDQIVRYASACGAQVELSFVIGNTDSDGACQVTLS
ncbi:helix-turn-helix domain-containing protein [Paracoccus hibiscisoli]|uniref:Helix-turn-helix transcriptional regulator n=1 Tax=Paracoccus hibiscisoli TaxID=2023261 RepID=A0A4U0QA13_9RHOB|nr:helix-turn-helix transcriptional regulator [Paracoccus hibiscisoli]TJZ78126.1 helix-turn-helix transcriptional regulator [Paracoccus hibiscisoli]